MLFCDHINTSFISKSFAEEDKRISQEKRRHFAKESRMMDRASQKAAREKRDAELRRLVNAF